MITVEAIIDNMPRCANCAYRGERVDETHVRCSLSFSRGDEAMHTDDGCAYGIDRRRR